MTNPQEIKFVSCPLNLAFWGSTRTKYWKCYERTALTLAGTCRHDSVNALRMIQDKEVSVQVRTNGNGSTQEFTESELEAAIIMYCIKRGIRWRNTQSSPWKSLTRLCFCIYEWGRESSVARR